MTRPTKAEHKRDTIEPHAEGMQTQLVTLRRLAELCNVTRGTLYRWMERGEAPPGVEATDGPGAARWRVHMPTLNAWVAERKAGQR